MQLVAPQQELEAALGSDPSLAGYTVYPARLIPSVYTVYTLGILTSVGVYRGCIRYTPTVYHRTTVYHRISPGQSGYIYPAVYGIPYTGTHGTVYGIRYRGYTGTPPSGYTVYPLGGVPYTRIDTKPDLVIQHDEHLVHILTCGPHVKTAYLACPRAVPKFWGPNPPADIPYIRWGVTPGRYTVYRPGVPLGKVNWR